MNECLNNINVIFLMEKETEAPFGINETKRYVSSGGEEILFDQDLIGDAGLVELVDYMGGDGTVERVAIGGYRREIFPEKPSRFDLIGHLAASGIYQPFSSVQLKMHVQSPIEAALTLVYDLGVSVNEYSGRYSEMMDTSWRPSKKWIKEKLSGDQVDGRANQILEIFNKGRRETFTNYRELLGIDMARELARSGLGIDNDTAYFLKMNLNTAARIVRQGRMRFGESDLTRDYIESVADIASRVAPDSWNALMDNPKKIELTMPRDVDIVDNDLRPASWDVGNTKRVIVPDLEEHMFEISEFSGLGQFQVVDYMGDDSSFAQAARVSYGAGTKKLSDDHDLTKSLIRDLHTSPIEMAELAMESRNQVFSDPRQAGRHRTLDDHGFMGYTPIGNLFYVPDDSQFKYQDRVNRQGRGNEMDPEDLKKAKANFISDKENQLATVSRLEDLGAPEDLIRAAKGVGFYTNRWRTGDVHNLGHFLMLRLDVHAQKEVRDYAEQINWAMSLHTPIAHTAIQNNVINGMRLSSNEIEFLKGQEILGDFEVESADSYKGSGMLVRETPGDLKSSLKLGRAGQGLQKKLRRFKD